MTKRIQQLVGCALIGGSIGSIASVSGVELFSSGFWYITAWAVIALVGISLHLDAANKKDTK